MKLLSPEYVAGFFDGEGCVNVSVRGKHRQVVLRAMIVNTDPLVLTFLHVMFGGMLVKREHSGGRKHWKPFRSLVLSGRAAERFLSYIAPFVLLKKPQVELALEFSQFMHLPKKKRCDFVVSRGKGRVPPIMTRKPEVIEKELEFKQRMHLLNRKGA